MELLQEALWPAEGSTFLEHCVGEITEEDKTLCRAVAFGESDTIAMTQEIWERCLYICTLARDTQLYKQLWNKYPELAKNMMRDFEEAVASTNSYISEKEIKAGWEQFEERMRKEGII